MSLPESLIGSLSRFARNRLAWCSVLWILGVGAGYRLLVQYSLAPSVLAKGLAEWPSATEIRHPGGRLALVLFLHPECPCSLATLRELEQIVARAPDRLDVNILFYAPEHVPPSWGRSELRARARSIHGASIVEDIEGREIQRFGAVTSGQAMVFDEHGHLRFSGGITPSRGHEGANPGSDAMIDLLLDGAASTATAPVFGCSLLGKGER